MPNPASLKNLRRCKPGQSGKPQGRPRAPRFSERQQHAILRALAGIFDEPAQRAAVKAVEAALRSPRTVASARPARSDGDDVAADVFAVSAGQEKLVATMLATIIRAGGRIDFGK